MRALFLFMLSVSLFSCQDDDDFVEIINRNEPDDVPGLNWVEAEAGNFTGIYDSLIASLTANPDITIVAEVDHARNASAAGMNLPPTRVVLFGNPRLGTPLMQANLRAGLDLPQKMLVYRADDGDVIVAYNTPDYLARRHNVEGISTLSQIGTALQNFAEGAGGDSIETGADAFEIRPGQGIITVTDTGTVDQVYDRLLTALTDNPDISVIAELDHRANAASVGLELPPSRLVVFGNPSLGTPLMADARSTGIDLPQKMLVFQNAPGAVTIAYNDPAYLADRHGLDDELEELVTIGNALEQLANTALGR